MKTSANTSVSTCLTPLAIDRMVWQIVDHGIASLDPTALESVRQAARRAGLEARVADLLVDDEAPTTVRERAFGRVAAGLARSARLDAAAAQARSGRLDIAASQRLRVS